MLPFAIWIGGNSMKNHDNSFSRAANLKAKAARYRSLLETQSDPKLVAEVQECVRALDHEAKFLEQSINT
jgi:NTP pyrophosphatase (non-canonical NTP hydrolase)